MSLKTPDAKAQFWPTPLKRNVGLFTDLKLFSDALEIGEKHGEFSKIQLAEGLSKRVKGLIFIDELSKRVLDDLVRELMDFEWIQKITKNFPGFTLTGKGKEAIIKYKVDKGAYTQQLIVEMHRVYTIPGWFVNRLWELNPGGQGEIVVPAPLKNWNPESRKWEHKEWDNELAEQAVESIRLIKKISKGAFPSDEQTWLKEVQNAWKRLSNVAPRIVAKQKVIDKKEKKKKGKMKTYAPRRRLFNAMKEAAVNIFFGNKSPATKKTDFKSGKQPLSPRIYMAWCPRLAELGLILYTDSHPQIPGRFIFPVSVFKKNSDMTSFDMLEDIKNPGGEKLFLHHPPDDEGNIKNFLTILYNEHQRFYSRVKSLYVSIMDVRDEVCQQLRISAELFDYFLEMSLPGTKNHNPHTHQYTISLESDIREDQGSGYQKLRRPVIINGRPYSLIAMTKAG
ncbi:hypothetical protein ACFLRT_02650 [Acidobacteriota bacterium]